MEGLELYNFAKGLFEATSPISGISDALNPLIQIALENTVNYNFFTGQKVNKKSQDMGTLLIITMIIMLL